MHRTWNLLSKAGAAYGSAARQSFENHRKRFDRNRTMWELMIWSFVVYHQFEESGGFIARAYAGPVASDDGQTQTHSDPVQVGAAEALADAQNDGAGDAAATDQIAAQDAGAPAAVISSAWEGSDGALAGHHWGGSHVHVSLQGALLNLGDIVHGATAHFDGTGSAPAGHSFGLAAEQFDPAQLKFFDGLKTFAGDLGFADGISELASATGSSAQSFVGSMGGFGQSALTPIAYWQAEGGVSSEPGFKTTDIFNVDWAVQLNGAVDGRTVAASQSSGWAGSLDSSQDVAHKTFGNGATFTDGGDWTGALAVQGNYYEFNTIIQVNVLWDNDRITLDNYGGTGSSGSPLVVRTGENVQTNTAEIVNDHGASDQAGLGDHSHQEIAGGVSSTTSVLQLNVITDLDQISLDLDGVVGDAIGSIDFASIFAAGHTQSNTSTVETAPGAAPADMTLKDYILSHAGGKIGFVAGNYYELNTVVQFNATYDRDTVTQSGPALAGPDGGGSDAITTGGTIQFNTARIVSNDSHDDLFVGGHYSEFNLVLQINVLDDSDVITQIRGGTGQTPGIPAVDLHGHDGGDGAGGADMAQFTAPSVFDDPMHRGGADMTG